MEQTRNSDVSIVVIGWFASRQEYRNPGLGGSLMKPVDVGSYIGLDRLATWNEVICATSASAEGPLGLGVACNELREMDSDFGGNACNLPEEDMWLAIAREMPDSKSN
jgi:hypothetical protein